MSKSTVKSIKSCYKEELRKQRANIGRSTIVNSLPKKKHVEQTLLVGDELDKKLQLYLKRIREDGGPVTAAITIAAARGLLMAEHKNRLVENGGLIDTGLKDSSREWDLYRGNRPLQKVSLLWRILQLKRRNFLMT